jgi:uncharacterized protein
VIVHLTLHLTSGCNMSCGYCYSPPAQRRDMDAGTVDRAVAWAASLPSANTGIIFFGGEPLLRRDLIEHAVRRCREWEGRKKVFFHFKVTTNGLLLDDDFLDFADRERIHVALSVDGPAPVHDRHRRFANGRGTFAGIDGSIDRLLSRQPCAYGLMTVTPETVEHYAEAAEYLSKRGFRYLVASLNYAGAWNDERLGALKREYRKLAKWYQAQVLAEKKVYFSPFEKKFSSLIQGQEALCQQCHFAVKQVSIAPDGQIYPCVQFVGDGESNREFAIGNVRDGIDSQRQQRLYSQSRQQQPVCVSCALNERCEHRCSCLNWQMTGAIDGLSPVLCESERILIPIADRLGETLFRRRAAQFIQPHYNSSYPLLSWLDDRAAGLLF